MNVLIQRTNARFIRKSFGHIGMLFKNKNKMYLTIPLRHCRRPLYAYINWCGSVLNRLFYQQPISICTICTIKTVCILMSIACKFPRINYSWFLIPDSTHPQGFKGTTRSKQNFRVIKSYIYMTTSWHRGTSKLLTLCEMNHNAKLWYLLCS